MNLFKKVFKREYQNVTVNENISENFLVDHSIDGQNLMFRIDYTNKQYLKMFSLKSPSGIVFTQLKYDELNKMASLKLPAKVLVIKLLKS